LGIDLFSKSITIAASGSKVLIPRLKDIGSAGMAANVIPDQKVILKYIAQNIRGLGKDCFIGLFQSKINLSGWIVVQGSSRLRIIS